jgi:hypothetical protein
MSISVKNISFCGREGRYALNQAIDISSIAPPRSSTAILPLGEFVTISDRGGLPKTT